MQKKQNAIMNMACLISSLKPGRILCAPLLRRMEILEIVDEHGRVCGAAPRHRIHGDNTLIHRVVHVVVTDRSGKILLQKRSGNKKVAPGKWDTSVGGHVDFAESIESALYREMHEELGVSPQSPQFAYRYIHTDDFESELVFTYVCRHDGPFRPDSAEIDELGFWSVDEIRNTLGTGILSRNFEDEFSRYLRWSGRAPGGGH